MRNYIFEVFLFKISFFAIVRLEKGKFDYSEKVKEMSLLKTETQHTNMKKFFNNHFLFKFLKVVTYLN